MCQRFVSNLRLVALYYRRLCVNDNAHQFRNSLHSTWPCMCPQRHVMDVGARSICGSLLLGGRTNSLRRFVDGYVVHRRLDGAASHGDIALVPRIGSVARMLLRDVARTLVDDCRSRRRDRCNWSGRWATLTWTMTAVRPRPFLLLKPPGRLCDVRPNCHYQTKHEQEPPPLLQLQHQ